MQSKAKKLVLGIVAVAAVAAIGVAGTLAYLTASTAEVRNTFASSGLIDPANFTLNESPINQEAYDETKPGEYVLDKTAPKVVENDYMQVMPSIDLPKDPRVTIKDLKAPAYLFLEVVDKTPATLECIIDPNQWEVLENVEPVTKDAVVYQYKSNDISVANGANLEIPVLQNDEVIVSADYEHNANSDDHIVFKAYLVQSAGFASAAEAWPNASA